MYAKIFQRLLQRFFLTTGRAPSTPAEWSKLRRQAMELARKEEGIPSITKNTTLQDLMTGPHISDGPKGQRIWDFSKDIPTIDVQARTADIIPFPKGQKTTPAVKAMMAKGDIQVGTAPKTTPEHLKAKKDRGILLRDADEDILRIKRENKEAIERFKQKMDQKPDIPEFAGGGIAPLVGEPSYAADFYDDRTPMRSGDVAKPKKKPKRAKHISIRKWPPSLRHRDLREAAKKKREEAEFEGIWRGAPPSMKEREKMYRKERTANLMEEERKEAFAKKIDERKKLYPYADMTEEEFSVAYPDVYDFMKKDPAFDFETFKKVSFANIGETFQAQAGQDYQGEGLPLGRTNTEELELFMTPFGDTAQEMTTEGPKYGKRRIMSDIDKAAVVLHELRHKKILQDKELVAAQPPLAVEDIEWRQKGPERWGKPTADDRGEHELKPPPHYKHLNPKGSKEKYSHPLSMHEVFVRYLDDQYGHTNTPSGPYFDKIWRDEWKPYADQYEQILKSRKDPEEGLGITAAAAGGRIGLAGGGALKKFIEQLFIKASNDIRLGRGKWKGLDQKQRIVQHDNLTKKVTEFEKTGNTEGLEVYFDVDPHTAFIGARDKVKRQGIISKKAEIEAQRQEQIMEEAYDEIAGGSGFSGDYKYDADILADSIAEVQGKVYADLPELERTGIYDQALKRVTQNLKAKMDFKKNLKDVEQKIELQMFDPKDRLPNQSGGPVDHDALVQMYLAEGLSYEEAVQAAQASGNLPWDTLKKAEGGRAGFIFGGSAGLRAMWKQMLKGLSKGRDKPVKRLFPTLSSEERAMEKLVMGTPEQKAFREGEVTHKIEGIDLLIKRLKHDKKILERQAKNKAMGDPGLDFLMKKLEENMSEAYTPHLKKYTDIDKDILQLETIKKNLIMKDRKLNAEGGRIGYAGGGKAGLPAISQGLPPPGMQQPQMPAMGPQPAGIPGGTIVAQNQMQQAPWMGPQMQQGMGGMPRPQPQGQPRMSFGLGGIDKGRRAFMKWLAGIMGTGAVAGTGLLKLGKAAKPVAKVTEEVIKRGPDGMPTYITDLIEVVKAKGTRDIIEGVKRSDYSNVHRYKGVEVIEDGAGNIKIKSDKSGVATDPYTGKTHEGIAQENHIQIDKGEWIEPEVIMKGKKGKVTSSGKKTKDEYTEGTVYPDRDGKMKDFEEGLDEAIHLDFKKIADEIDTLEIPGYDRFSKASGGLAYALGE